MSIVKATLSFGAGEWTPWLDSRTDLEKYTTACQTLRNFISHPQGVAQKRPGMSYLGKLPPGVTSARLIEFQTSVTDASMLIVGGGLLRIYTAGVPVLVGGIPLTLALPWADSDLLILRWKQINDVMYFVHPAFPPYKLTRYGPTDWELVPVAYGIKIPLLPENLDDEHTVTVAFPTNGTAPAWSGSSIQYKAGDRVTYSGTTWVCLINHLSTAGRIPPTGTIVVTIPSRTPQTVVKRLWVEAFVDGSAVVDQIVDLTASLDTWDPQHVGAVFEIAKKRKADNFEITQKATTSSGNIGTGAVTTYSSVLVVQGHWSVISFGTWQGIFTIEKSDDRGITWEEVRSWHTLKDEERNVSAEGDEDTRVLMRIKWQRVASEPGTLSGVPRMTLTVDDGKIRGLVKITQVIDARTAKAVVLAPVEATTTYYWSEGAWSDFQGYPRAVELHQARIFMAATKLKPHTVWGSASDDYEDFYIGTDPDEAFGHTIAIGERDPILWLISERYLLIGTGSAEFIMHGEQEDNAITPEYGVAKRQSSLGSHNGGVPAAFADSVSLFVQRGGTRIREFSFKFEVDRYENANLSLLSEHFFTDPVDDIAIQRMPFQIVWFLSGGKVYGMTYERMQNVAAWHRHETQGEVISLGAIRGATGEDEVWFLVRRGGDILVERFQLHALSNPQDDGWWMDSAVTIAAPYDVSTIPHLAGKEVISFSDGDFFGPTTLTGTTWPFATGIRINGIAPAIVSTVPPGIEVETDPNGLFRRAGTRQGKPWYVAVKFPDGQTNVQWIAPYGGVACWAIYLAGELAFTSTDDVDTPDLVTTWASGRYYVFIGQSIVPVFAAPGDVTGMQLVGPSFNGFDIQLIKIPALLNGRVQYSSDGRATAPSSMPWAILFWSGSGWQVSKYDDGVMDWGVLTSEDVPTPDLATTWPNSSSVVAQKLISAESAIVGLPYTAALLPMKPEIPLPNGTSRSRELKVHRIVPSLRWSRGGKFGQAIDGPLDPIPEMSGPGLHTGEFECDFDGGYDRSGDVAIISDEPYPFAIRSLVLKMNVYGDAT
ncbi:MAG: hypothetical protein JWO82_1473 [Akkermansiaceae bacterium]|nr:hypothetical protein [Akkermansiaceae bacterium]